jgi:hypothetical protein
MSKTTDLFAASAAALILACVARGESLIRKPVLSP